MGLCGQKSLHHEGPLIPLKPMKPERERKTQSYRTDDSGINNEFDNAAKVTCQLVIGLSEVSI